ncbi:MAG: ASKHA domain-containing protein [Lachnospiraceae bacterium]
MKLEIIKENNRTVYEVPPRANLFLILREKYAGMEASEGENWTIRSDCGGNGRCGKCSVILESGLAEYQGTIVSGKGQSLLSCRTVLCSDCVVRLPGEKVSEEKSEEKVYRRPVPARSVCKPQEENAGQGEEYGIAVDIGTTNVKFAKVRLPDGEVLTSYACKNSQGAFGADVMSRIRAACDGEEEKLTALVQGDIRKGIGTLLSLPEAQKGEKAEQLWNRRLRRLSVACNTTMLSLLCGFPLDGMQEHPFTPYCLRVAEKEQSGIAMRFAPCAGAFIGGDIVAGLAALPLHEEVFLLIDLGTNGELVLGTKERMLAVSVAAGPAFESGDFAEGTSALAAFAEAYRSGAVDETGLLSEEYFETGYPFVTADGKCAGVLTQRLIRDLQMAKAAVRTGVEYLLKSAGVMPDKVYLAGGMGSIAEQDCIELGMLPGSFFGKTEFVGNTALAGAIRLLLEDDAEVKMQKLASRIEEHDLAEWGEFEERYLGNLNLPERVGKYD